MASWAVLVLCRWVVQLIHLVDVRDGVGGLSRSTRVCLAFLVVALLVNARATLFLAPGRLINVVPVDTPRLFNCGARVLLRSAATCPLSLAPLRARLARFRASMRWPMHARSRTCSGLTASVPLPHPLPG